MNRRRYRSGTQIATWPLHTHIRSLTLYMAIVGVTTKRFHCLTGVMMVDYRAFAGARRYSSRYYNSSGNNSNNSNSVASLTKSLSSTYINRHY